MTNHEQNFKNSYNQEQLEKYIAGILLYKPFYKNTFYFHEDDFCFTDWKDVVFGIMSAPDDYKTSELTSYLVGKGTKLSILAALAPQVDEYINSSSKDFISMAQQLRDSMVVKQLNRTFKESKTAEDVIAKANELSSLERLYEVNTVDKAFGEYYDNYQEQVEKIKRGENVFIATGIKEFDAKVHMEPSEFLVCGARTSIGKTMFALWIAYNAVLKGNRVLYINLEMSQTQIMNRIIAMANQQPIADFKFFKANIDHAVKNMEKIGQNFLIQDGSGMKTDMIRKLIMNKNKVDLVVIDYLNLLTNRSATEQQRLAEISNKLKTYAKERNCAIMGLCQLNRDAEKQNREPDLADIKDSSGIEQAADTVFLLHKEDRQKDEVDLFVRKQRNGNRSNIKYNFNFLTTSYRELKNEIL